MHDSKLSIRLNAQISRKTLLKLTQKEREFPDSLVVRTWHLHYWGPGWISGQRTKIPSAEKSGGKKKKKKNLNRTVTCLLKNLYAGQEATVRTGHGTTDWFQIGKGVRQGCRLSPCLFNLYAEYIMRNAGLEEAPAGIKIARRHINNLRYADDPYSEFFIR